MRAKENERLVFPKSFEIRSNELHREADRSILDED
jgi:hypothetical protein